MPLIHRSYNVLKNRPFGRSNRAARLHRAIKKLSSADHLEPEEKALLHRVSLRVHPNDTMYAILSGQEYLSAGLSALR